MLAVSNTNVTLLSAVSVKVIFVEDSILTPLVYVLPPYLTLTPVVLPWFTLRTFSFDDVVPEVKYITSFVTEPPVSPPAAATVTSAVLVVMVYGSVLAALVFAAVVGVTVITQ